MYYSITICPNLVPNSLHLPLLSHGHQGHWPRWPPKLPPTAASLPSLSSWGKESVLASRMCGEATPASAQMARLRTQTPSLCHFLALNNNYLYFKIPICALVEHLDLAQYNADYPFSVFFFLSYQILQCWWALSHPQHCAQSLRHRKYINQTHPLALPTLQWSRSVSME